MCWRFQSSSNFFPFWCSQASIKNDNKRPICARATNANPVISCSVIIAKGLRPASGFDSYPPRSNAYYGAWALSAGSAEIPLAAATARVSATEAFHLASKENIQTHGGIGFTWAVDCHLFYRRSKNLALALGGPPFWKNRLVDLLETRNAA